MSSTKLSVFLSYAFKPKQEAYKRSDLIALVESACETVKGDFRGSGCDVSYTIMSELENYGKSIFEQIHQGITASDFCIVDISDNNPNVFYELGVLHALKKPSILMKSSKGQSDFAVPSDISGFFYLGYDDISDIRGRLASMIHKITVDIISVPQLPKRGICLQLWEHGDSSLKRNIIVAPKSSSRTKFAKTLSPNFIYLDRMGDKDSVLELSVLLARIYPDSQIARYTSDSVPQDVLEENLIIVGGPGGDGGGASNKLVGPMHDSLGIPLGYSDDCDSMILPSGEKLASEEKNGVIVKDYAFFAKAPNPFHPDSTVVIVHGIHTYGVLGAARCFSDHPRGLRNIRLVLESCGAYPSFWSYFSVDIVDGVVMVPSLPQGQIFRIDKADA